MKRLVIYMILLACYGNLESQVLQPAVYNTDGGHGLIKSTHDTIEVFYNIGEPIYEDQMAGSSLRFTQGFLQPDIVTSNGSLSIHIYTMAISCRDANDASILVNASGIYEPFYYHWYKNEVLLSDTTSKLTMLGPGTYIVKVSDENGHERSDTIVVLNSSELCEFTAHNGFTPNGDGVNDGFVIDNIDAYPDNTVSIFNRWGNIIWEEKGYNNATVSWKGESRSGHMLPAGTYFFIVEANNKKLKGWVELIR